MGVEAAMGQADLFHDLGDARAVVPSSPSSARGGRDDPFVGDFLAAWGGPPGGGSAHMMSIIYQSGAERKGATRRAAVVDRNGLVVAVVFTGATSTDQWPGSRVIAAQKANTANAFSLPHLALSTANLYAATQPGGTLFGLQEANPTNEAVAYGGDAADYG